MLTHRISSICLFWILILLLLLYFFSDIFLFYNKDVLTILLLIVFFVSFVFIFTTFNFLKGQIFRPSFLFILGFIIVNFQKYIDIICGYIEPENIFYFVDKHLINKACLLSLSGLVAFCLGYLSYNPHIKNKVFNYNVKKSFKLCKYFLFCSVLCFLYYNLNDILTTTYSQSYLESRAGTMAAYVELIIKAFVISVLILYNIEFKNILKNSFWNYIKGLGFLFWISVFSYVVPLIILGDRGPLISIFSVVVFSYVLFSKTKFDLKKFFIILLPVVFFFNFIGSTRKWGPELTMKEKINIYYIDQKTANENNSVVEMTNELSGSVNCLHHSLSCVPEKHPYLYGSLQFRSLVAIIPFASKLLSPLLDSDPKYYSSAFFITYMSQGYRYKYGTGSSVVADLYLSFDIWGIILFLGLFGALVKNIEFSVMINDISKVNIYKITLAYSIVSGIIYMSRSTIMTPFAAFIPSYIIIFLSTFKNK